jgi:hypothetical protein
MFGFLEWEFYTNSTTIITFFTSIHKGFLPAGAKVGEDAENSLNTEIGFRFRKSTGEIIVNTTTSQTQVLILCQVECWNWRIYSMQEQPL